MPVSIYSHKEHQEEAKSVVRRGTSLRRMQCTMTITKPSRESKTAKRIWKSAERRSVMARTADIHVRARRGKTTQELHKDALQDGRGTRVKVGTSQLNTDGKTIIFPDPYALRHLIFIISFDLSIVDIYTKQFQEISCFFLFYFGTLKKK